MILLLGKNGQLGSDLYEELYLQNYEVKGVDYPEIDFTKIETVLDLLNKEKPDTIINCVAYTDVEKAETDRDLCYQINCEAVGKIAEECKKLNIHFIHISTDYVLDGSKPFPEYSDETTEVTPLNFYGVSKFGGEEKIIQSGCSYVILRTASLYGMYGQKNFLKTITKLLLSDKPEVKVIADQFSCPTSTKDLASQIIEVYKNKDWFKNKTCFATCSGYASWFEFAYAYASMMGLPFEKLTPCKMKDFKTVAVRPQNSIVECNVLKDAEIYCMENWLDELTAYCMLMKNCGPY